MHKYANYDSEFISWTTLVVHSRDDEGMGIQSIKPMGQCWLGKTKPKKTFRFAFNKLLQNLRIFDWLTN